MDSVKITSRLSVAAYRSMVDAGVCCSIEEINDPVMRAAGLRPVPKIVERISALEGELKACKARLQILEAQKNTRTFCMKNLSWFDLLLIKFALAKEVARGHSSGALLADKLADLNEPSFDTSQSVVLEEKQ